MKINKNEVLRYLGYNNQSIDENLDSVIDECICELLKTITPKHTYHYFKLDSEGDLKISDTNYIMPGNDIKLHLKDCNMCIILAVTLGIETDTLIRKYEFVNMTKALILDACASVCVETVHNNILDELEILCERENKFITTSFSPGYGDFSISFQKIISKLLATDKKIGLTFTENFIMIPRKSITSIIGVSDKKVVGKLAGCENCVLFSKCNYRKKGITCEN